MRQHNILKCADNSTNTKKHNKFNPPPKKIKKIIDLDFPFITYFFKGGGNNTQTVKQTNPQILKRIDSINKEASLVKHFGRIQKILCTFHKNKK